MMSPSEPGEPESDKGEVREHPSQRLSRFLIAVAKRADADVIGEWDRLRADLFSTSTEADAIPLFLEQLEPWYCLPPDTPHIHAAEWLLVLAWAFRKARRDEAWREALYWAERRAFGEDLRHSLRKCLEEELAKLDQPKVSSKKRRPTLTAEEAVEWVGAHNVKKGTAVLVGPRSERSGYGLLYVLNGEGRPRWELLSGDQYRLLNSYIGVERGSCRARVEERSLMSGLQTTAVALTRLQSKVNSILASVGLGKITRPEKGVLQLELHFPLTRS